MPVWYTSCWMLNRSHISLITRPNRNQDRAKLSQKYSSHQRGGAAEDSPHNLELMCTLKISASNQHICSIFGGAKMLSSTK